MHISSPLGSVLFLLASKTIRKSSAKEFISCAAAWARLGSHSVCRCLMQVLFCCQCSPGARIHIQSTQRLGLFPVFSEDDFGRLLCVGLSALNPVDERPIAFPLSSSLPLFSDYNNFSFPFSVYFLWNKEIAVMPRSWTLLVLMTQEVWNFCEVRFSDIPGKLLPSQTTSLLANNVFMHPFLTTF